MSNIPTDSTHSEQPTQADPDKIVASYLKQKGYAQTEAIFLRESKGESVSLKEISDDTSSSDEEQDDIDNAESNSSVLETEEEDPNIYDVSYKSLREWIENSLDWYKPELRSVLFPIFVHSFLDLVSKNLLDNAQLFITTYRSDHVELHTLDLDSLATVTLPEHVRQNELAQLYRNNKYSLRMSGVPFELFLNYLQDNKFMLLLRIVNQYLNIQVVHGKLLRSAGGLEMDDVVGIIGHDAHQIDEFNKQDVQLALSRLDPALMKDVENAMKENGDTKELIEKFRDLKGSNIPLPPYRKADIQAEVGLLHNIEHRIPLNSTSLPTMCCHTFHNTHDSLNCVTITKDTSLIAGGFSESFVKIWSLKGEKLRSLSNNIDPASIHDVNDLNRCREKKGSEYKKLIGHSGAVYGLSFSHDNQYIVTASEDRTARLWSTQTYSNLVVYKGHNGPVWDVDFGPLGFYFATGSHDRTARLWSCDHINPLRIFAGHLSDVDIVKFHPNSKYLATGSSDRTSRLWDVEKGNCVRIFTGHTGTIKTIAMSPNGCLMATAGEDRSIMLWDLGSGKRIKKMTGHTGFIYTLSFSQDNSLLVSGSADCTVRVWDVNTDSTSSLWMDVDTREMKRAKLGDDDDKKRKGVTESREHLAVFPTKQTPIYNVQFTHRNLCLVSGAFTLQKAADHH
ncbi:WD40 repeat-like protein [Backusella circina FSU 941]|nr:WD40 repeat-like protein [Backusella circina FSU 941]